MIYCILVNDRINRSVLGQVQLKAPLRHTVTEERNGWMGPFAGCSFFAVSNSVNLIVLLRFVLQCQRIIAEMLHPEAVPFVGLIVERFQFVHGELMELIKIVPPFIARAK